MHVSLAYKCWPYVDVDAVLGTKVAATLKAYKLLQTEGCLQGFIRRQRGSDCRKHQAKNILTFIAAERTQYMRFILHGEVKDVFYTTRFAFCEGEAYLRASPSCKFGRVLHWD